MVAIPDRILANWRQWYGEAAADSHASDVAARAEAAIDAWRLEGASVMEGGEVALVLAARGQGREVVCKLNPADPTLAGEAVGLASWRGLCPELLGTRDRGRTILMERLTPGTRLGDRVGSVEAQLELLGGLVGRLHAAPAPRVPRLAESGLASEWLDALQEDADRDELRELLAGDEVVIHTDLHSHNVLEERGDWRIIDPKPFRAMAEAEIWALVVSEDLPGESTARALERRIAVYCEASGLDPEPTRRWTRLRALAEASLGPAGSDWQRELNLVADAIGR
ncbi:MAG: hypothetical protein FJW90_08990 [Actinobacteria bacterium]|nr:hypothetical protein [Actinomycetota bacterium]